MLRKLVFIGMLCLLLGVLSAQAQNDTDRIRIEGDRFIDPATGEAFVPRGVNYLDFVRTERGTYEDRTLATDRFEPDRVRAAFANLSAAGYNTVRFFFDQCGFGDTCIGNPAGDGLNPVYLDNLVILMTIAKQEGIYLILTANSVPEAGGYWERFVAQYDDVPPEGFTSFHENAHYLTEAGVAMHEQYWRDLMSGLAERDAPFEVMLGWSLQNEFWLFGDRPPLSLERGEVMSATGTYDMSTGDTKQQMVVDGTLHFIETLSAVVREYDPEGLVTMGFFVPDYPNETDIGGDWWVETAPILEAGALDFYDFHAYYDADLDMVLLAENFGMLGYDAKPIIMGEVGAAKAIIPSAAGAFSAQAAWIQESCAVGFDGWLHWLYYPQPEDMESFWALLDDDGLLFEAFAPHNQTDPCEPPSAPRRNIAFQADVETSDAAPEQPGAFAVDGTHRSWTAGDDAPQWIEINFDEPQSVSAIYAVVDQWPAGETLHQVTASNSEDQTVMVTIWRGVTTIDQTHSYELPAPLHGVERMRITTLESSSWPAWREINIVNGDPDAPPACILGMRRGTDIYAAPDGEVVNTVGSRQFVLADTQIEGWFRLPNGVWVLEDAVVAGAGCGDLPGPVAEAETDLGPLLPVRFQVTVPPGTEGPIYIAGTFGPTLPEWEPGALEMERITSTRWTITLEIPAEVPFEYKYTRGDWETVEKGFHCEELSNRGPYLPGDYIQFNDVVWQWRDVGECD